MSSATPQTPTPNSEATTLLSFSWDDVAWSINLSVSLWFLLGVLILIGLLFACRMRVGGFTFRHFEIDQAEIGVGTSKVRFKPSLTDRQVAYAIWVELSTRKIGLPIDLDHDVISEIYDSWYDFFAVTRGLIKSVPVTRIKRDSTQAIIKLSIEVLNEGLRPHLTRWQARFRHWYERELGRYNQTATEEAPDPQELQTRFPQYEELKVDMKRVNQALIRYRAKMSELVLKD